MSSFPAQLSFQRRLFQSTLGLWLSLATLTSIVNGSGLCSTELTDEDQSGAIQIFERVVERFHKIVFDDCHGFSVQEATGTGTVTMFFHPEENAISLAHILIDKSLRNNRILHKLLGVAVHSASFWMNIDLLKTMATHFQDGSLPPLPYYVAKLGFSIEHFADLEKFGLEANQTGADTLHSWLKSEFFVSKGPKFTKDESELMQRYRKGFYNIKAAEDEQTKQTLSKECNWPAIHLILPVAKHSIDEAKHINPKWLRDELDYLVDCPVEEFLRSIAEENQEK